MLLTTSQLSATDFDVANTGSNMTVFVTPNATMSGDFEDVSQIGIFYTNDAGELACAGTSSFSGSGAFQITLWGSEAGLDNGMADGEELTWLAEAQNGYLYNVTPTYEGENMNTYTLNAISFIAGIDFTLDASSIIEGCMDGHSALYNPEANLHNEDMCTSSAVLGCTDNTAVNYNEDATEDDGSCEYAATCDATELTVNLYDSYGDGWNGNTLTVAGQSVTMESGSESVATVCVDLDACNTIEVGGGSYGSEISWTIGDLSGSVGTFMIGGCVTACGDENATNYNADADIVDNTLCEYAVAQGCMDETACNFDAAAEADNGSCEYPAAGFDCEGNCASGTTLVTVDGGAYLGEKSWTITSCDGSELLSGGAPFAGCADLSGSYTLDLVDSYGDGWDGTVMTIGDATYTVESGATASFDMGCAILGCTDATAENFNTDANEDDGSCTYAVSELDLALAALADAEANIADLESQLADALANQEDGISQADVDAVQALLDAIVPEDGISQADVDAVQALLDAIVPEDGITQADVDAVQALLDAIVPEDGITQTDVDAVQAELDNANAALDAANALVADLESQLADALENQEDGISQADVDAAYADGAASVTPEDGITQADVDAVQSDLDAANALVADLEAQLADALANQEDGVSQADVDAVQSDLDAANALVSDLEAQLATAMANQEDGIGQADVDAAYADGAASVTPEDGVSQADVDAAVSDADAISAGIIADLQAQLDEALLNSCAPIYIDIVEGWNILGYTLSYEQDVAATLSSIEETILIVKDNNASVYWPEFGFNGIGNFIPGQGYQIKTSSATANYTWPNVNGERIDMSPTVPQWAADMEVDVHPNDIRSLVKVVNMLGQEVNLEDQFKGEVVLYLYNDGTVDKKIVQ